MVVEYYKSKNKDPINNFIDSSSIGVSRKIIRQMLYVRHYGLRSEVLDLKKLQGCPLWEIRILGHDNIRIFCFQKGEIIYILHIFAKKSMKTPQKEINLAMSRLKELLDR